MTDTSLNARTSGTTEPSEGIARRLRRKPGLVSLILLPTVLIVWEVLCLWADVPRIILPRPSEIGVSLWNNLTTPSFYHHVWVTLKEALYGFGLGASLGFLLGALIGQSVFLERVLYPYLIAFETLPKAALAPLVLIWFGYDMMSKVVVTAMIAFFPLLANTIVGLRSTSEDQIDLFRAFCGRGRDVFWKLKLPNALPFIFVGLNVSLIFSLTGAIIGEFVGSREGLGYLILIRNQTLNIPSVFSILVVLGALGCLFHVVLQQIKKRVLFWAPGSRYN